MFKNTLQALQRMCWKQQIQRFKTHETERPYYFVFRAMAECGELCNLYNKEFVYGKRLGVTAREHQKLFEQEFGDVLYFLCLAASVKSIDLTQCLKDTHARIEGRLQKQEYGVIQRKP